MVITTNIKYPVWLQCLRPLSAYLLCNQFYIFVDSIQFNSIQKLYIKMVTQ